MLDRPPCQCTQAHHLPVGTVGGRMAGTWNPACSNVSLRPNAAASLTTPSTNHQITLLQHNTPRHAPTQQASAQHSIAYAYTPGPLLQPLILPAGTVRGQMAGTWNPASSRVLLRPKAAASLPSTRRMTGLTTGTPFPPVPFGSCPLCLACENRGWAFGWNTEAQFQSCGSMNRNLLCLLSPARTVGGRIA